MNFKSGKLAPQRKTLLLFACILYLLSTLAYAADHADTTLKLDGARIALTVGDYHKVIGLLEPAPADADTEHLVLLAESYIGVNLQQRALDQLERALGVHTASTQTPVLIRLYHLLGTTHRTMGRPDLALQYLGQGIDFAQSAGLASQAAFLFNDLGTTHISLGDTATAITAFDDAMRLAEQVAEIALAATASVNLSKAILENGNATRLQERLEQAQKITTKLPAGPMQASNWMAIGNLYEQSHLDMDMPADWLDIANDLYLRSLALAEELQDERLVVFALGYLGRNHERRHQYTQAQELTQRAIFKAQQLADPGNLYLWEWQLARIYAASGDNDAAISAYRRALNTLSVVRDDLLSASVSDFYDNVGAIYFQTADLLLKRASHEADADQRQAMLIEARDVVEQLKTAEIVEYFDNQCLIVETQPAEIEALSANAVILYPILLDDRVELLVSNDGEIHQYTSFVDKVSFTREVRLLRTLIEQYDSRDLYLPSAQKLYNWLIRPFEAVLASQAGHTLVIVPGGALRTIPLAALHDGTQFLVEKYPLATTPGMTLTSPTPLNRGDISVLANGLTESVQGYSALPSVEREISNISSLYRTTVYTDEQFLTDDIERLLAEGDQSVVHIATHGEFNRDHTMSYLLTYDDRLSMNRLERTLGLRRYEEQPVELLVLSACETAAGDDRAALGLAGVALKAGARSALASLWFINDASTSDLITRFYTHLKEPGNSKAEALRQAQISMIASDTFRHPAYWAPFLMIGNWL